VRKVKGGVGDRSSSRRCGAMVTAANVANAWRMVTGVPSDAGLRRRGGTPIKGGRTGRWRMNRMATATTRDYQKLWEGKDGTSTYTFSKGGAHVKNKKRTSGKIKVTIVMLFTREGGKGGNACDRDHTNSKSAKKAWGFQFRTRRGGRKKVKNTWTRGEKGADSDKNREKGQHSGHRSFGGGSRPGDEYRLESTPIG